MAGNWKKRGKSDEVNFWPAFADMAAATCMMLTIIWLAGAWQLNSTKEEVLRLQAEISRLKKLVGKESELVEIIKSLEQELTAQKNETNRLQLALVLSDQKGLELEAKLKKLLDERPNIEPPNIVLKQEESFVFDSLQAVVPKDFEKLFKETKREEVIEALNSTSNIEVIEIIGHTDNKKVEGTSNVDATLEAVYAGNKQVSSLEFGSNCELGLARAIAVKKMLQEFLETLRVGEGGLTEEGKKRLEKLEYRTYSAAQLFPTDPLNPGRSEDRRIEIRFTRLRKTTDD